jgi:hypothetical protein
MLATHPGTVAEGIVITAGQVCLEPEQDELEQRKKISSENSGYADLTNELRKFPK